MDLKFELSRYKLAIVLEAENTDSSKVKFIEAFKFQDRYSFVNWLGSIGNGDIDEIYIRRARLPMEEEIKTYVMQGENAVPAKIMEIPSRTSDIIFIIGIYLLYEDSKLLTASNVLFKYQMDQFGIIDKTFPKLKDIIPVFGTTDQYGNNLIFEYRDPIKGMINMSHDEMNHSNGDNGVFLKVKGGYYHPYSISYYKPDSKLSLTDITKMERYRYKVLDLSMGNFGEQEERKCSGMSHWGACGSVWVSTVEIIKRVLETVTADLVILPDDIARRHINTIKKNERIKGVRVSEKCKLFSMIGEDLYNKKGSILMYKSRLSEK